MKPIISAAVSIMLSLADWTPCPPLSAPSVAGTFVRIDPYDSTSNDAQLLWNAFGGTKESVNERLKYFYWLGDSPYDSPQDLRAVLERIEEQSGWCVNVMRLLPSNKVCGMASFLNPSPLHGAVEVGYVAHGFNMEKSPASTEAHYLLAKHVFDNGYRRYEWKCDSNNMPSQQTALRLGFEYEGTFRQHRILWNRENRDTCWYSMLDCEWPLRRAELEAWLSPENYDSDGKQLKRLAEIRQAMTTT